MGLQHQIGGKRAKGFAALSLKERQAIASKGGSTVVDQLGRLHMAKLGSRGGTNRARNAAKDQRKAR